jgi:hypothetical protein
LVDLAVPDANATVLGRLERAGLTVSGVVGNKVLGEIDARALPGLRRCPDVREVEDAVRLRPTNPLKR